MESMMLQIKNCWCIRNSSTRCRDSLTEKNNEKPIKFMYEKWQKFPWKFIIDVRNLKKNKSKTTYGMRIIYRWFVDPFRYCFGVASEGYLQTDIFFGHSSCFYFKNSHSQNVHLVHILLYIIYRMLGRLTKFASSKITHSIFQEKIQR